MFKQSRKKIIISIMGSLIVLLAVTLFVILFASYREIQERNSAMLRDYAEIYSLEPKSDSSDMPEPPMRRDEPLPYKEPDFQLSTFYGVAIAKDGSVLKTDNGMKSVYDDEELIQIAKEILNKGYTSGRIGTLMFRTAQKDNYTLVAFIDNTVTYRSMNTLWRYVLIVGASSITAMFLISLYLSKKIIFPLEENDKRQKQFISDASHELKTPISIIAANSELLYREIGENEWLGNIRYENEQMTGLVTQLLDLSHAESAEAFKKQTDLSRIVAGEALAFESMAFDKGKIIRSDIEENISIIGNPLQLTRLVSVLLDNAIRHSTGKEIEISFKRKNRIAYLSVINDGDNIPLEKQEHIFDRFYRIDEARNSGSQHYGLGLSIAKAVAKGYGGNISVSCHDGKIKFTAYLKIK